jgi:hypothetical protein
MYPIRYLLLCIICFCYFKGVTQSGRALVLDQKSHTKFLASAHLIDASINSLNSLGSLIRKENYRNKITSLNNPASAEMGFNLEIEIQAALKPILEKATRTNTSKFSEVIASIIQHPIKNQQGAIVFGGNGLLGSVLGLVANLTVQERRISKQDLDTFLVKVNKYFLQYEKLNQANNDLEKNINAFSDKLQVLQFDIREHMMDLIIVLFKQSNRQQLKYKSLEELQIRHLDKSVLDIVLKKDSSVQLKFPGDAIKASKEMVYGIQKLFEEYQKIYADNYEQIRMILLQSKVLGINVNIQKIDQSLESLEKFYLESKDADILNLRLQTLAERLKVLVQTDQD